MKTAGTYPDDGLTHEERKELADLERDEQARVDAVAQAAKRQHLEALRLSKRLASKHGEPGKDFLILETRVGNIAIRRPKDVELDAVPENSSREDDETFAAALVIEPTQIEFQKLMAEHPSLASVVAHQSLRLIRVMREEEAKK